jgi:arylformamidase
MTTTSGPRRADIDSFYTCRHADEFQIDWRAFYTSAERRTDAVRARWSHKLDVAYGSNLRQRLDIYFPSTGGGGGRHETGATAVFLFFHGGGFREGDPALYGYLAEPFVQRGSIFVSAGYRLTPETYLPETFQDAEAALHWCHANLGGGPVLVTGHSAGGILTAQLAVRSGHLLQAAIPISGVYDFTEYAEFFADDAPRVAASPLLNIKSPPPHTLVAYGSRENRPNYGVDSQRLVAALRDRGAAAECLELDGMDHADTVNAIGDESSVLFQAIKRLIPAAARP